MEQDRALRVVAMVLGFGAHLGVGFFYLAAGLVVPGPYLFGLWVVWVVLLAAAIRRRQQPTWVLAAPVAALAILIGTAQLGGTFLDWRP